MGVISIVRDPSLFTIICHCYSTGVGSKLLQAHPTYPDEFSLSAPGVYPQKLSQNRQSLNQRRCGEKTTPSATKSVEMLVNCPIKNNLAKFWFSSSKSKKNKQLAASCGVFFLHLGVVSLSIHWQYTSPMPLPEDLPVRLRHDGPLSRPCVGCVDVHTYIVTSIVCTKYHAWCGIGCCVSYQQKVLKTTTSRLNVYTSFGRTRKKRVEIHQAMSCYDFKVANCSFHRTSPIPL